jgi:hypothetical protein
MGRRDIDDTLDESIDFSGRKNKNENGFRIGYLKRKELEKLAKEYKIRDDKNLINIIPYKISSEQNALLFDKKVNLESGDASYLVRFSIHRNIGINNDSPICPKHTYGKPCPICEENHVLYNDGNLEEAKRLMKSDRALYWVEDLKSDEANYMFFDQPTFYFEQDLLGQAKSKGEDKAIPFASPTHGHSISFLGEEKVIGKTKFLAAQHFDFKDRREQPGAESLEKTFDLSDYLILLSYEELKDMLYGKVLARSEELAVEDEETQGFVIKDNGSFGIDAVKEENSKSDQACPSNLKYGIDHDSNKACDKCPSKIWESCFKESKKRK